MIFKEVDNGKTPNGGDYSEIYYFDDNNNPTDKNTATYCLIRECRNDGTIINVIYGKAN